MPVREMGAAILMVPPPPPPPPIEIVALAENPAFEAQHPRSADGRFTTKDSSSSSTAPMRRLPYEGEQEVAPEVQAFADRVSDLLQRLGYNVPRVHVTTVPPETMKALTNRSQMAAGDIAAAFAQPGRMVILPDYADRMANIEKTIHTWNQPRMRGLRPSESDKEVMRLVVHEILHQVGAVREWNAIPQIGDGGQRFLDGIQTEEGVVEAVTLDVCNLWGRKWGATFPFFPPGTFEPIRSGSISSYKDRTVEIRRLSSMATGQHWQSRAAMRWRRSLLNADFVKRKEMIDRVRANPRRVAKPPRRRNLAEDARAIALVSPAVVTDIGPVLALGQVSIPSTPRKITRGMLRSMLTTADGPLLSYLRAEMADSGSTLRLQMVDAEIERRRVVEDFFGAGREQRIAELAERWGKGDPRGWGGRFKPGPGAIMDDFLKRPWDAEEEGSQPRPWGRCMTSRRMTRADAERWASSSAISIPLYHGTSKERAARIKSGGMRIEDLFADPDPNRSIYERYYGGMWFTPDRRIAEGFAFSGKRIGTEPDGEVLTVFVKVDQSKKIDFNGAADNYLYRDHPGAWMEDRKGSIVVFDPRQVAVVVDERDLKLSEVFQEHLHPRGPGGKFTRKFKVDLPESEGGGQKEVEIEFRPADDDDRRALKIPPAWTDVYVTDHPTHPLRAMGKDSKGRTQRRYSAEFLAANQAAKFERLRQFDQARETVLKATEADDSDAAMIVRLIALTGIRPGSEKDTGGAKKAYGATTLQAEHAKVEGNKVIMDFVGKEGIDNHFEVDDPILAKWFKARLGKAKEGEQIFAGANDTTARKWMARNGGEGFLLKDFRTWVATATALRMVKESSPPPPVDEKDFQRRRKEIATHVSGLLNNTPQMALSNYISPAVFDQWRVA